MEISKLNLMKRTLHWVSIQGEKMIEVYTNQLLKRGIMYSQFGVGSLLYICTTTVGVQLRCLTDFCQGPVLGTQLRRSSANIPLNEGTNGHELGPLYTQ